MKVRTLAIVVLLIGTAGSSLSAQSASVQSTATILVSLSLTKNSDLNLGIHNPGAGTVTTAATSPNAGKFTATGTASTGLKVSYPGSVTLSNGASTLAFSPSMRGNATDSQSGTTSIASGATVTLSTQSRYFFWLGGSTTIGAATPTGTYTGTFTLTVQY